MVDPVKSKPTFFGEFFRKEDRVLNVTVVVLATLAVLAFSAMAVSYYCCPENPFPGNSVYLVGSVALTGVGILVARIFIAVYHYRNLKRKALQEE